MSGHCNHCGHTACDCVLQPDGSLKTPSSLAPATCSGPENGHPLVIPFDGGSYAVIPLGITHDDFECLKKTLDLWENRIVKPEWVRKEVCKYCGNFVSEWVDPDWAGGRICRQCETLHEPAEIARAKSMHARDQNTKVSGDSPLR